MPLPSPQTDKNEGIYQEDLPSDVGEGGRSKMTGLSRRDFLAHACTFTCAGVLSVNVLASGMPTAADGKLHRVRLQPASHGQVQLLDSQLQEQLVHQRTLFMGLDEDRLLKPFRARAGQPAPGRDMGGWYDDSAEFHIDPSDWSTANWHGYIPGHAFGQYISGLARMYAANHDEQIRTKVETLVTLYIPTISGDFFKDYNLPAYTYNKLVEGLIDAYQYAGVKRASEALDMVTDAVLPYLPEKALTREERRQRPYTREAQIWDEPYVLPENLFKAWRLGLGERYRNLALRFLQDEPLFDPLARGLSPFAGKHAYSHVNALSSAIEAYYATGSVKYLKAAINGFAFLERQSYATGGWGPNEELLGPDDQTSLAASLTSTPRSFETPCGAHAHFKITRSLLCITGDSRYGDSMERVLYNTILGARPTTSEGDTFYYSDYSTNASKVFRGEAWPCCSGTFVQLVADYGISAYMLEANKVHVNLYIPSRISLRLDGGDAVIEQQTEYPLSNTCRLKIVSGGGDFQLLLRIPQWASAGTEVHLNGVKVSAEVVPGQFFTIARPWRQGDAVEIQFDMSMRLEPIDKHHSDLVALMTGPLVLFPINTTERKISRDALLQASRISVNTWAIEGPSGTIRMKPFMAIEDEPYHLYNSVSD